jgi:cytidine deaminase
LPVAVAAAQIHAEQCLVLNCIVNDERGIEVLAVSEAPCGHCRQFYAELSTADTVRFVFGRRKPTKSAAATSAAAAQHTQHHASVVMHEARVRLHEPRQTVVHTLDELLIDKFGPDDLAGDDPFPLLLQEQNNRVQLSSAAQQTVAQRAQGPSGGAFSKAAQEAARWANSKVGWG